MSEADPMNTGDSQAAMLLGEMRGQLREVVHGLNNLSTKFDGLTREVVALGSLATLVGKLEATTEQLEVRIKELETRQNHQTGATATVKAILNSPALAWIFLAAVAFWAAFKGKIEG